MKKFEIGMVIQAIDKVTGPAKGISASIRKMAAQSEAAGAKESHKAAHHAKHNAKAHGHGIGGMFHEGIEKAFEVIPEVAAVAGIVGGIEGMVEGFKKLTEASDEAATAQTRLKNMMMHVKGTTHEDIEAVNELAEKMEGKTAYKHTIFEMAASQLAAFGMNGKQIKSMMPAMADYLAMQNGLGATNEDAILGAKLLGKAYAGNSGALRRAGIVFTAAQEAILKTGTAAQRTAVLIKGIEGKGGGLAAKQALDPKGQIQQANNVFEVVKEKLGAALTPIRLGAMKMLSGALPYVRKFADEFPNILARGGEGLTRVGAFLSENFNKGFAGANIAGLQSTFTSLVPMVQKVLMPIVPIARSIWAWFAKALGQIGSWLIDMWNNSQPAVKAFLESLQPIIAAIGDLWHNLLKPLWDSVLAPLLGWLIGQFVPFLLNGLGPSFKFIGKTIGWVINLIVGLLSGIGKWLGAVWPIVSKFFVTLWARVKFAFYNFKAIITQIWHDIWDGLFKWLTDKWDGFLDIFRKVGEFLGFSASANNVAARPESGSSWAANSNLPIFGGRGPLPNNGMTLNGMITVQHDPELKVRVQGNPLLQLESRLGAPGFH